MLGVLVRQLVVLLALVLVDCCNYRALVPRLLAPHTDRVEAVPKAVHEALKPLGLAIKTLECDFPAGLCFVERYLESDCRDAGLVWLFEFVHAERNAAEEHALD